MIYEHVWSAEGLTRGKLFTNFLRVNLEGIPAGAGRYFRRMLHHLISGPQAQCLPLSLVWLTKNVGNLQMSSDKFVIEAAISLGAVIIGEEMSEDRI